MIYLKTWQKATFIIVLILFIATSVTNEPQIKAVLAGHLHFEFESRLPNGAMQFVTNRGDRGNVREITII